MKRKEDILRWRLAQASITLQRNKPVFSLCFGWSRLHAWMKVLYITVKSCKRNQVFNLILVLSLNESKYKN
jgi:hypothetical protein